jgi:hypothetical protein
MASEPDGLSNGTHYPGLVHEPSADGSPLTVREIRHIEDGPQLSHKQVPMDVTGVL